MRKSAEITILGCAGSGGVPFATNYWGNCDPNEPKNRRTRASIAIESENTSVLIDCGPDFHQQSLRENIKRIDAVFFTHPHSDHVNGIDDLRYVAIKQRILGQSDYILPIYANDLTLQDLHQRFPYLFKVSSDGLYIPLFDVFKLEDYQPITINNLTLQNFVQHHGEVNSLGYRIGDVTYSTDVSALDDKALSFIKGTRVWIVDCGQYGADFVTVHANFDRVMEWQSVIGAEKIYLTHLTPRIDYQTVMNNTPDFVECAYDGLRITAKL